MSEEKEVTKTKKELEIEEVLKKRTILEEHRNSILRHKDEVLKNCILLANRIISEGSDGSANFGRELIVRGYAHDNSKLQGVEHDYLIRGSEFLQLAHQQHVMTNDHHPEYWLRRGMELNDIPPVAIAEMVCDLKARSSEFGTNLRTYIKDEALPRWEASPQGKFYRRMKQYLDILLDDPF